MATTIRQRALILLAQFGFQEQEKHPGKWWHPSYHRDGKPLYVYIGKGHSIRVGPTKATSIPTMNLASWLVANRPGEPLTDSAPVQSPLTIARKRLHHLIGQTSLEGCNALLGLLESEGEYDEKPTVHDTIREHCED